MSSFRLCSIILFTFCLKILSADEINLENVKIWGPGLYPDRIVLPARYFFIDTGVQSLQEFPFQLELTGSNKHNIRCRVWQQVLDRKDGSYIVRYKLYETCNNFNITIKYKAQHVPSSPYTFSEVVYSEECDCPKKSFTEWKSGFQCHKDYERMEKDLKVFQNVDFDTYRSKILGMYNKPNTHSICNYVILDNQIYRRCYGKYVGFSMFMDSILLSVTRKVLLPNLELFVNLGDWPLSSKGREPLPIFSWCGSHDTYDVVMPTYDITESTLENMGRVMLDMLSVQGNIEKSWKEKIPKVFWRGRDSNRRRLDLIDISRQHPDLFNVSITRFFFFRNEMDKYGPQGEYLSFFKFFDYKYQLNIDGTVAAYRYPYLLAGDSLVLKQSSKYYEWFDELLVPDQHFLQVREDLTDLVEKLHWAIDNDAKAEQIAKNGQQFARDNLMPIDVICYYAVLLEKWSKKIKSEIKVQEGMEHVAQPSHECQCSNPVKDEL